jgi:tRNA pseudouridine-54 N-methylase
MDCIYIKCSIANDEGVEELISKIIEKCIDLENQVVGSISSSKSGSDAIFTLGGSDGLTSGDIKNINPMKLQVRKRNNGCCGGR